MNIPDTEKLLSRFDPATGIIAGATSSVRRLSDLRGCFADSTAYENALTDGDPVVYSVATVTPAYGEGDLHVGLGVLMPGRIGSEYFMTRGHLHSWREAAEVYVGLTGEGALLLENEEGGESRLVPIQPKSFAYVPGRTAHRTINTGTTPLTYLGIYSARAGHDYGAIAARNFRSLLVERSGLPQLLKREA